MRIAWVTDSTAFVPNQLESGENDIYVVPMSILFGEKEYMDGIDLSPEELFAKLRNEKVEVKTSQPSIGRFKELFEQLSRDYDYIFSIHVSSHFSGTYSSAYQAAELLKETIPNICCIDSKILSNPLTELIQYGQRLSEEGKDTIQIKEAIEERINSCETYVMVGSLEQLHKSGRMGGLSFFLGSVLKIKPMLSIEDGKLKVKEKVRSIKKGLSSMSHQLDLALANRSIGKVSVLHGLNREDALEWMEQLRQAYPEIEFGAYPLGAVIGVHAGENTIGISWFSENK
ncbi:DegV family protein [Rossellomorea vietnamensis]|uniref:Fatty acid-binding protein DegV n=1 Tax=Rossellomorea vietnamensis TaxID=218284 RepID=A0A0N8GGZ1_9BACI|nr:DegV family protein [Rossellomorea vietnamensis]KPL59842.1 fatty acid-binding protein DegV [Rossellomorea vietnamensis]